MEFPEFINSADELNEIMTAPTPPVIDTMREMSGDLMILGAGGKMGISLSILAKRASESAGVERRVIAISRFSSGSSKNELRDAGVEAQSFDLMNFEKVRKLPDVQNVIYMIGTKFGSAENSAETWAVNTFLPGIIARQFRESRIVLFSTGNVYPLVSVDSGGCKESDPVGPIGEYAQSALGRERIFEHFSRQLDFPGTVIRLNYAIDLRYGVLLDIGHAVYNGTPVHLSMGFVNLIWQGDANGIVLRSFDLAATPPFVLNVTSAETISVRDLSERFGELFGVTPKFEGEESDSALLSNAGLCVERFGRPAVDLDQMIKWIAHWIKTDGPTLAKPTHFETRNGKY